MQRVDKWAASCWPIDAHAYPRQYYDYQGENVPCIYWRF